MWGFVSGLNIAGRLLPEKHDVVSAIAKFRSAWPIFARRLGHFGCRRERNHRTRVRRHDEAIVFAASDAPGPKEGAHEKTSFPIPPPRSPAVRARRLGS